MKKLFILFFAAALFTACDKIADDEMIIYAGAAGEWYDGNSVADHSQRALLEKYTGVRCNNCPDADTLITEALANYNGKLIAVSIHDSNWSFCAPYPDNIDMRTEEGNIWSDYFRGSGTRQYPEALVNRKKAGEVRDIFTPTSGINSHVDPFLNQNAKVAIATNAELSTDNKISISVNIEFLEQVNDSLTLTLFMMEDGLVATQMTNHGKVYDYVHNHILRDVITDVWGDDIKCTGAAGEKRMAIFNYDKFLPEWILSNCHIVAFVSNKSTREILNVAETHID